ncbi:DUF2306 domain-containing protein [Ktedonosporobacter rubrisoli]|uniref:DUF2306 domain-containing protein n=1 Tax=Ktedonosporobacter rubrisoli TaxID=2509675 RepID=A0A4P6JY83_KTERU|nr:DUF2306 domain-containing protein [Ktedonosporobacter rubrisoli]QBD80749.1 DUF2306 domain-containing protein [Ktedonosporobacter rubrisoli]
MAQLVRRIGWGLMALLAIGIALAFAAPYLSLNSAVSRIPLNPAVTLHFPILVIHATTGGLALVIGPFQFLRRLFAKRPALHRTLGRIYLICILLGGLAALFSALVSTSGFVAQFGLGFLAIIWLYSAYRAYETIRKGHIQLHRIWMRRNYTLTFAAVIFRLWLLVGALLLRIPFHAVYDTATWFSWILPLLVTEWFINQQLLQALAVRGRHAVQLPAVEKSQLLAKEKSLEPVLSIKG